jgi:hypothetical protein
MAATRGEYATYGVGAFLACVSRVRDGATARRRDALSLRRDDASTRVRDARRRDARRSAD